MSTLNVSSAKFTVYAEDETGHRSIEYTESVKDFGEATERLRADLQNGADITFAMDVWHAWIARQDDLKHEHCADLSQTVRYPNGGSDFVIYEYRTSM